MDSIEETAFNNMCIGLGFCMIAGVSSSTTHDILKKWLDGPLCRVDYNILRFAHMSEPVEMGAVKHFLGCSDATESNTTNPLWYVVAGTVLAWLVMH
jgi:hypothetical protein